MYQTSRLLLSWSRILPTQIEAPVQRDPTVDNKFFARAVELA